MSLNHKQQLLQKNILDEIINTYHQSVDIPIQVIDSTGDTISTYGAKSKFCDFFSKHIGCNVCRRVHLNAAKQAVSLGDSYIFFCPAGLTHYVSPLLHNNAFYGALVAGPLMMEYPNELFISNFIKKYNFSTDYKPLLFNYLCEIPVVSTTKVRHYSKLLFYISLSTLESHMEILRRNRVRTEQQSKISEAIHYSKINSSFQYPYDKEKALYTKVRSGDVLGSKELLNEILGHIFFAEGGNLNIIKSRVVELCSILSRAAVEGGASIDQIFKTNNDFINELSTADNIEELSFWLLKVLDVFTENVLNIADSKNKELMEMALHYIHQNFSCDISLTSVAEEVHLNATYFSTLFKAETGVSFTRYINDIRIDEAKHLLSSTNSSILEIAIGTGFEDQGYFSKVFRRLTGVTPTQYRKLSNSKA